MFRNYLKTALRNLLRHRGYSLINLSGLAIGLACFLMIMLWVQDEFSFDRFHHQADRIYRFSIDAQFGSHFRAAIGPAPAGPLFVQDFPEVVDAVRIGQRGSAAVRYGDKLLQEDNVVYADASFFNVFSFPLLQGDPATALQAPYSLVLTKSTAQKYFGDEDPLGQVLKLGGDTDYTVTGVVADFPANSHLQFNMLRSLETLYVTRRADMETWFNIAYYTYLLLEDGADARQLEAKFPEFIDRYMGESLKAAGGKLEGFLQPMTGIHLHSDLQGEMSANGSLSNIYLFSAIGIFILIIACVNFINLSTARSSTRAREVGLRKTLGADRLRLILQFIGESVGLSLLALFLAYLLIELLLPSLSTFIGRSLSLNLHDWHWISAAIAFSVLVGSAAGFYPALLLSSFLPVSVLKGGPLTGSKRSLLRSTLVVFQFAISIVLMVGTFVIYGQLRYMKTKHLGFEKEHVVVLPQISPAMQQSLDSFRGELLAHPAIEDVAATEFPPGRGIRLGIVYPEGFAEDQPQTVNIMHVDEHYIPTLKINLLNGRNFSSEMITDPTSAVILNEAAARHFGWDDPIGKTITAGVRTDTGGVMLDLTVVGLVSDYHMTSLKRQIEPLMIGHFPVGFSSLTIRIAPGQIEAALDHLRERWAALEPNRPFDYFFLDETFDNRYRAEERMGKLALTFSLLAIFIGCLGLFGMASFAAQQRTKEIGIRKVLGATATGLAGMLSVRFLLLVVIANAVAWPAAYYLMTRWLENFAYRIELNVWIFLLAGCAALLIAQLTVSYQALKAAYSDPVKALRYE